MSTAALPDTPSGPKAWRVVHFTLRAVLVSLLAGLTGGFVVFVQTLDRSEVVPMRKADGIVVFTGGVDRIADALALLLAGRADRLLISGVNPTTSGPDITRAVPGARNRLSCCIELGYTAGNTIGNARETRGWVHRRGLRSLIVVTSNYHMPRALAEIGDAAPGIDLLPYPVVSERGADGGWWHDGQRLRLLASEYAKYLIVLARTHLMPSAPYRDVTDA